MVCVVMCRVECCAKIRSYLIWRLNSVVYIHLLDATFYLRLLFYHFIFFPPSFCELVISISFCLNHFMASCRSVAPHLRFIFDHAGILLHLKHQLLHYLTLLVTRCLFERSRFRFVESLKSKSMICFLWNVQL